jgi:hypothetical protein
MTAGEFAVLDYNRFLEARKTGMSGAKMLAFALFVLIQAAAQDASKVFPYPVPQEEPSGPQTHAQCKFSDGKTIAVDYYTRDIRTALTPYGKENWQTAFIDILFVTDESLITVKGTAPAGEYSIVLNANIHDRTLIMTKLTGREYRVPMSLKKLPTPADSSSISFEHTGGSCMMRVNWKNSNTQLSVEFTEKNADLPVEN